MSTASMPAEDFASWYEDFSQTFCGMPPELRREFGERWLQLCSPSEVAHLAERCVEMSYRDFITQLPPEVAAIVLQHLDWFSLLRAMRVSASWRHVIVSSGCSLWLNKRWPWPIELHGGRGVHPYDIILTELQWRQRLNRRLLECKLTLCMTAESAASPLDSVGIADKLAGVTEFERLSAIAWNGDGLLAAFPHHPQGVVCRVLNPKPFLGVLEATLLPFAVPGGCRTAKFLSRKDLILSSYSGFDIYKVIIGDDMSMTQQMFSGHANVVLDFVASVGGSHLVSLSRDHTVKVWDYNTAECLVTVHLSAALKPVSVAAGRLAEGPSSEGKGAIAVAVYFQECVKLLLVPLAVRQILPVDGPHVLLRVSGFKGPAKGDVILLRGRSLYFTGVTSVVAVHLEFDGKGQVQSHTVKRLLLDTKSRLQAIVPFALHPLSASSDYGVLYALSDLSVWQWADDGGSGQRLEMQERDRLCPGLRKVASPVLVALNWPLITARSVLASRPMAVGCPSGKLVFSSFFLETKETSAVLRVVP